MTETMTPDDYFGGCPECGGSDGLLYSGRDNWFFCDSHLTKWWVGSNLFSGWRFLTHEELTEQHDRLFEYREVEPVYPEPTEEDIRYQAKMEEARKVDQGYGVYFGPGGVPLPLGPRDNPFD